MNEMVERVARAIRTYGVRIWGAPHLYAVIRCDKWDAPIMDGMTCEFANVEAAKLNARAAIEAMRAPTDIMVDLGWEAYDNVEQEKLAVRAVWTAMIDAALKEG